MLSGKVSDCHGTEFSPHCYIEWGQYIIDFRARLWLGSNAQHGFLGKSNYGHLYAGQAIIINPLPDSVYALMLYQPSKDQMDQLRATK